MTKMQKQQQSKNQKKSARKTERLSEDLAAVAIELIMHEKIDAIGWRGPREHCVRSSLAWLFNYLVFFFALLVALIYALKFGEVTMSKALITWAVAYGWTFAIVEPVQVVILALSPCLFDEETRCGRCMVRGRTMYNELCAP